MHGDSLNLSCESVFCSLCVPFFNPGKWAETFIAFTEIFTWFKLFSLQFAAPVIVDVALPAVPATRACQRLVLIIYISNK